MQNHTSLLQCEHAVHEAASSAPASALQYVFAQSHVRALRFLLLRTAGSAPSGAAAAASIFSSCVELEMIRQTHENGKTVCFFVHYSNSKYTNNTEIDIKP